VIDVIDRLPVCGARGQILKRQLKEKLQDHRRYINLHGQDLPEIRQWTWRT